MNSGNWKLSNTSEAIVISSGQVYIGNKKPRSITLAELLDMIKEHPDKSYYVKEVDRVITLGEAIKDNNFESLGQTRKSYRGIDLNGLKLEREFEELPNTGKQLLSKQYKSRAKYIQEEK